MTENTNHKSKKSSFAILRGMGRTPAVDWMVMAICFTCLVLAAGVWGALGFIGTKSALQNAPLPASANQSAGKTQEEEAEEILQLYDAKNRRHLELLGTAKIDTAADKKNAPAAAATSTATSSASAASASASASASATATSSSSSGSATRR